MKNSHENRVKFPEEISVLVLFIQHGRLDVTCKYTVRRLAETFLGPFFWVIGGEEKLPATSSKNVELFANFRLALKLT